MADNIRDMSEARKLERGGWLEPKFLAQMLTIIIGLITIFVGGYVMVEARATKLEIVGTTLTQQAQDIKTSQARIEANVQQVTNNSYATQAKVDAQEKEIEELRQLTRENNAWIIAATNKIAKLEAKLEK